MTTMYKVTCQDGEVRHEPFNTREAAVRWAEWGHFCTNNHTIRSSAGPLSDQDVSPEDRKIFGRILAALDLDPAEIDHAQGLTPFDVIRTIVWMDARCRPHQRNSFSRAVTLLVRIAFDE